MGKQEVSWTVRRDDGGQRVVLARRVGGEWRFMERRQRRYEQWVDLANPSRDDWEMLADAIRRRYQRKGFTEEDVRAIERIIAERFPE